MGSEHSDVPFPFIHDRKLVLKFAVASRVLLSLWAKMGKLWPSARVWAALDLLPTCDTISEARDTTSERLAAAGAG